MLEGTKAMSQGAESSSVAAGGRAPWYAVGWPELLAVEAYTVGAVWRWLWVYWWHDPRTAFYSDMDFYRSMGQKLATPGHVLTAGEVTHPPGLSLLMAWLYRNDPSGAALDWLAPLQLLVALAAPLALAAWAGLMFGRRTAVWALAVASLYFPFIDYSGYVLAESYVMLLIPLTLAVFVAAMAVKRWPWALVLGVLAGMLWCLGISFKLVVLPGVACFALAYVFLYGGGTSRGRRGLVVAAVLAGLLPGLIWMSARCTSANEGRWCLVSNKNAADFLLGHYGRVGSLRWQDPAGHEVFQFGSPAAIQRGYMQHLVVPFKYTDSARNTTEAWRWIRGHPVDALVLSCEHVYDLFLNGTPWPTVATPFAGLAEAYQFMFVALLLFPTALLAFTLLTTHGPRALLGGPEFAVFAPIIGLMAAAFVATGELRYRIPWDGVFIILAIKFYRRAAAALGQHQAAAAAQERT